MNQKPNREEQKTPLTTGNTAWNKPKMYIMRGVPGSGKSTRARQIAEMNHGAPIFSTDDYWMRPDGRYDWNFRLIGEAHQWNKDRAKDACKSRVPVLIIDNTNTTAKEYQPYIDIAKGNGYEVELVAVHDSNLSDAQIEEFAARNTHGVPLDVVKKMARRFESVS